MRRRAARARARRSRPISPISASFMPRVVTAGVPSRTPDVTVGLRGSKGTMFLFAVMPACSSTCCACLPVTSRSTSESRTDEHRCRPTPIGSALGHAVGRGRARWRRSACSTRGTTVRAGFEKGDALPAITCISGRPARPGTPPSPTFFASGASHRIIHARGRAASCGWSSSPAGRGRSGDGCTPVATSPAMCAMSAKSSAPTSSAISRKVLKSITRE